MKKLNLTLMISLVFTTGLSYASIYDSQINNDMTCPPVSGVSKPCILKPIYLYASPPFTAAGTVQNGAVANPSVSVPTGSKKIPYQQMGYIRFARQETATTSPLPYTWEYQCIVTAPSSGLPFAFATSQLVVGSCNFLKYLPPNPSPSLL